MCDGSDMITSRLTWAVLTGMSGLDSVMGDWSGLSQIVCYKVE